MNVVVDGLMTSYQKIGSGKQTLLFLPGWGDDNKTFAKLIPQLVEDYSILILDLPGFGGSQAGPGAWGLDDYANFIKSWLAKIEAPNIYGLIGHSNGGGIAIRAISLGALEPARLVLIAAAGVRDQDKVRKKILKAAAISGRLITAPLPAESRKKLRRKVYARLGSDAGLFPQMEGTFRKIISQDVQADAGNIKIPTLLIYGDADKSTPAGFGKIFQRKISGSRLEIIEGAGHYLHQQQSEKVADLISNFLKAEA